MVWDQSSESISEKDKLENKLKDIIPNDQISDITQDNNGYTLVFKNKESYTLDKETADWLMNMDAKELKRFKDSVGDFDSLSPKEKINKIKENYNNYISTKKYEKEIQNAYKFNDGLLKEIETRMKIGDIKEDQVTYLIKLSNKKEYLNGIIKDSENSENALNEILAEREEMIEQIKKELKPNDFNKLVNNETLDYYIIRRLELLQKHGKNPQDIEAYLKEVHKLNKEFGLNIERSKEQDEKILQGFVFAKNVSKKIREDPEFAKKILKGDPESKNIINEIYKESMEEAKILYQQYLEYMEKVKKALDYNKVMNTYMFINMDYEQKSKKVEEERRFVESKNNEEFKEFYYSLFGLAVADSLTDNKDYKKMFKEYSNYMSKIDDSAMPITKEQGVKEDVNTIITGVIEGTGVYKHVGVELAENIKDVVNVSDKLEDSIKIDDKEETKKNMLKLSIKLYELREKLEERLKNAIDKEEHEKIKQAIERIDELQKRLKVSAPKVAMS